MASFRGQFVHALDSKGRLSVPNRFRDVLKAAGDECLMVTYGPYGGLAAYPMDKWAQNEEELSRLPTGPAKNAFLHHFVAPAQELTLDRMGRLLIPAQMREKVGLEREIMVVGALDKFEIWDKGLYDRYLESTSAQALDLLVQHDLRF